MMINTAVNFTGTMARGDQPTVKTDKEFDNNVLDSLEKRLSGQFSHIKLGSTPEEVELTNNKQLLVNGKMVEFDYNKDTQSGCVEITYPNGDALLLKADSQEGMNVEVQTFPKLLGVLGSLSEKFEAILNKQENGSTQKLDSPLNPKEYTI